MAYLVQEVIKLPNESNWSVTTEKLFKMFDFNIESYKGLGTVNYDRMQYFLLAILITDMADDDLKKMPAVIARQTRMLMDHMGGPIVNQRMFREYLISKDLTNDTDVQKLL